MTMAVWASKAWMPRKSSFSASGGVVQSCQVAPSSWCGGRYRLCRSPQATPLPREWMPRRLAVVWDCWMVHWACVVVVSKRMRARRMGEDTLSRLTGWVVSWDKAGSSLYIPPFAKCTKDQARELGCLGEKMQGFDHTEGDSVRLRRLTGHSDSISMGPGSPVA